MRNTGGCNQLKNHPVLKKTRTETQKEAQEACLKYVDWSDKDKANMIVFQGEQLAAQGELKDAVSLFQKAKNLDSNLDFNPKTKANKLATRKLDELIEAQDRQKALTLLAKIEKIAPEKLSVQNWNRLCWYGSLTGKRELVFNACENAVKDASEKQKASHRDSRGLNRALTGNVKGAIKDFQFYVDANTGVNVERRQQWIEALKKGENPFTPEELEYLRNE